MGPRSHLPEAAGLVGGWPEGGMIMELAGCHTMELGSHPPEVVDALSQQPTGPSQPRSTGPGMKKRKWQCSVIPNGPPASCLLPVPAALGSAGPAVSESNGGVYPRLPGHSWL